MKKIILLTGATDGIGLQTAKQLAAEGHHLLLHGRSSAKLEQAVSVVSAIDGAGKVESYVADLSDLSQVYTLADQIAQMHGRLDVVINNAGVFNLADPKTGDGLDARFAVNTIAPYILTKALLPLLHDKGRVVNLSSAAQASVDLSALVGAPKLSDNAAYAQSKLAILMWTQEMANQHPQGPVFVAINPASFLGSKMVKEAYGVAGGDLSIGADIICRAALSEEFASASGLYFDNDIGQFAKPHSDAQKPENSAAVIKSIDAYLSNYS
jgi:NAD(P)-dependent dehydrogenase (short-subunit alcohol dehydrogenase family)